MTVVIIDASLCGKDGRLFDRPHRLHAKIANKKEECQEKHANCTG
jgi:hypothetical protein